MGKLLEIACKGTPKLQLYFEEPVDISLRNIDAESQLDVVYFSTLSTIFGVHYSKVHTSLSSAQSQVEKELESLFLETRFGYHIGSWKKITAVVTDYCLYDSREVEILARVRQAEFCKE